MRENIDHPSTLENELTLKRIKKRFPDADGATIAMAHATAIATMQAVSQSLATLDYQTLLACHKHDPDPQAVETALRRWIHEQKLNLDQS